MISSAEAFSIFRKWQQESSSVELLTGTVQDAPTPKPPRRLARVVEVSEPKEIVLQPWGEGARQLPLICAALRSSTPILVKRQNPCLGFGFVSLRPDFRLDRDGCLERGIALDYLGAAWRNPFGACCGGSRVLSRRLGDAGLGHFFLDAGECRFVRFVRRFPYRSHIYLELQEKALLALP
jgi:hypothetical protein